MADWLTGVIKKKIQWNERLFSLRIAVDHPHFVAGQFIRVALDVEGERIARPYSIVSTPEQSFVEIFFNIVPEGPLSPALAALEEGDDIFVADRCSGFLTVDEVPQCRYLWMFATGTGVGPFLSILQSAQCWQRFDKLVLGYSVRNQSELAYSELIESVAGKRASQFVFVPFITRELVEGSINKRIPDALESGELETFTGLTLDAGSSHVMMCGNSAMLGSVAEVLQERGMHKHLRRNPGHYSTEKYH